MRAAGDETDDGGAFLGGRSYRGHRPGRIEQNRGEDGIRRDMLARATRSGSPVGWTPRLGHNTTRRLCWRDMSHLLQLLLLLAALVATAKLAAAAANRIGQPAVFGEILAGLLLGPTFLNILGWPVFASVEAVVQGPTPPGLVASIKDLADLGVILLMFIAGLETDLVEMRRVGTVAFWAALGGVLLPLVAGALTAAAFGQPLVLDRHFHRHDSHRHQCEHLGADADGTDALRSREGTTILGAAVIDDVMGIVVLSLVVAFARQSGGIELRELGGIVLRMAVYFGGAIVLGRMFGRIAQWAERLGVSQGLLAICSRSRSSTRGPRNMLAASLRSRGRIWPVCSSVRRRSSRPSTAVFTRSHTRSWCRCFS